MAANKHKTFMERLRHLNPAMRVLISLAVAGIFYISLFRAGLGNLLLIDIMWVGFACTFISLSFLCFFKFTVAEITKRANEQDGSRAFFFFSILVISAASLFTILILFLSDKTGHEALSQVAGIAGMMSSWALVHTTFTFHYAHLYYTKSNSQTSEDKPLDFPGDAQPDYLDFAYFSFVLGMTFQVSDVDITTRHMRRVALGHSLIAFAFNTFVVALTINLIAGMKQ